MRKKIIEFLDEPTTGPRRTVALILLTLIYISVAQLVVEIRYPAIAVRHEAILRVAQHTVLAIFTLEFCIRLICDPHRWKYLGSFYGIVDFLAIAPGLIGLVAPIPNDTAWIRALRIFRFGRALKFLRAGSVLSGITGRLAPFFALAVGFKGLMVALEGEDWWPEIGNLTVVIGVAGFALALLLGTKVGVITLRFYTVEDAICRIVGTLRSVQANDAVRASLKAWALELENVLFSPDSKAIEMMKSRTKELGADLENERVVQPAIENLSKDVEFLLHRATTRTHRVYERFLRHTTIAYTSLVVIAVPGLTGFFASGILIYILGGMYLLIDDMDRPLDFSDESLISIDIHPLKSFNASGS